MAKAPQSAEHAAAPDAPAEAVGSAKARLSLAEQIAKTKAKLKELEDQERDQKRRERERNAKAVAELIRSEKLDLVSADEWTRALPAIKKALGVQTGDSAGDGAAS